MVPFDTVAIRAVGLEAWRQLKHWKEKPCHVAAKYPSARSCLIPKFGSVDLSKFMNVVMESGKKAVAERIIYGALEQIEKKANKDPLEIFMVAINNVKPMVEVKSRRVGGANYQVPVEVRPVRRMALAMRWLKDSARKRGEKSMSARLANELLEASEGRGGAMKKRDEVHRMAEANKAFSHFRF